MKVTAASLSEVKIIEPKIFADSRGFFFQSFQQQDYEAQTGLKFVQDNISRSSAGVLRGLHYQLKYPQGKLVTVITGKVFDVAVDIRYGSPTFGKWAGDILSDENHKQLYIPPGFAHGFCVLSETVNFHYKCTDYYHPEDEYGIAWNDKNIAIDWPNIIKPILSTKDTKYLPLTEIPTENLPQYNYSQQVNFRRGAKQ